MAGNAAPYFGAYKRLVTEGKSLIPLALEMISKSVVTYGENGVLRGPKVTPRVLADMRKRVIRNGEVWPAEAKEKLDKETYFDKREPHLRNRTHIPQLFGSHKRNRGKEERDAAIAANMAKMPEMIANYRAEQRARREKEREKNYIYV